MILPIRKGPDLAIAYARSHQRLQWLAEDPGRPGICGRRRRRLRTASAGPDHTVAGQKIRRRTARKRAGSARATAGTGARRLISKSSIVLPLTKRPMRALRPTSQAKRAPNGIGWRISPG